MSTHNSSEPIPTAVLIARRARKVAKSGRTDWFPWQLPWMRVAIGGSVAFQLLLLVFALYVKGNGNRQPIAEGDLLDAPVPRPKMVQEPMLVAKAAPNVAKVAEPAAQEKLDLFPVRKDEFVECARIGTDVRFMKEPAEAFKRAREEKKMVFMVHLSGNLEDKEFT
jgi:hypothetical protein